MRLKFGPIRDVILLITGLGILGHETLAVAEPRYLLIMVAGAMIGLPATFFADRKFVGSNSSDSKPPPELPSGGEPDEADAA